ncbi:MAG: hypothetical protein ACKVP5_21045 [Aestuariivirga sp.]
MNDLTQLILAQVVDAFSASARREEFNGISAKALVSANSDESTVRRVLKVLVREGQCNCTFASVHINPAIKRQTDLNVDDQVNLLRSEELSHMSVYPSRAIMEVALEPIEFVDRPFTRELALATAQLEFVGFELAVIDRYTQDPNYKVEFNDYMGHLGVCDAAYLSGEFPSKDKIGLQKFGLGFGENKHPCIVVFYRYLADLTAEHQQYWKSYKIDGLVNITEQYYQSSFEGKFWENRSARYGLTQEIMLINTMTEAIWGNRLFRTHEFPTGAASITAFSRPTRENLNNFIHTLDKMLSENIQKTFFRMFPGLEGQSGKDRTSKQNKGTITLLRDWLQSEGRWESVKAVDEVIIKPIREIRNLRQKPAHILEANDYSVEYYKDRKRLLWGAFNSLSNIRAFLSRHPKASHVEVPEWLDSGRVDVF